MEKGKSRHALKKRDDLGTGIEPILPRAPRLQRSAGNVEPIGGLPLGEPSGLQVAILLKEFSASASLPSLVTSTMAPWLRINDSAHSSLLTQPWLCVNVTAKDGEGAPWLQPFRDIISTRSGRRRDQDPQNDGVCSAQGWLEGSCLATSTSIPMVDRLAFITGMSMP
jgi:hypothetical protein